MFRPRKLAIHYMSNGLTFELYNIYIFLIMKYLRLFGGGLVNKMNRALGHLCAHIG